MPLKLPGSAAQRDLLMLASHLYFYGSTYRLTMVRACMRVLHCKNFLFRSPVRMTL